jgi:maltooligosyltrehalose trehalohydrolase
MGLDAIWSDDFHHVVRVMLTGTRESYYKFYEGTVDELVATLEHGWLFEGRKRQRRGRGEPAAAAEMLPEQFLFCITNHDQTGNHAFGARLNHAISPAAFRAASALLCLVPFTPLIFMGQEWAASSPFQYFTDHEPKLGHLVTEGRRQEFRAFDAFRDPVARETIPDPQGEEAFLQSKLRWDEMGEGRPAATLQLYREFLQLRRQSAVLRDRSRDNFRVLEPSDGIVRLLFGKSGSRQCLILADLVGGHRLPQLDKTRVWQALLSSNERRFGGEDPVPFSEPEVRVFGTV